MSPCGYLGVSMAMGVPLNAWFLMENPMKKWMMWGYPHLWKPPFNDYIVISGSLSWSLMDFQPQWNTIVWGRMKIHPHHSTSRKKSQLEAGSFLADSFRGGHHYRRHLCREAERTSTIQCRTQGDPGLNTVDFRYVRLLSNIFQLQSS